MGEIDLRGNEQIAEIRKKRGRGKKVTGKMRAIIAAGTVLTALILIDIALAKPLRSLASEQVRQAASQILNEAILGIVGQRADTENRELTRIETDDSGNSFLVVDSDTLNLESARIVELAQSMMRKVKLDGVGIPMGTATGIAALSGFGPRIEVKFEQTGSIGSELVSFFRGEGINQTRYCVVLKLTANIRFVMSGHEQTVRVVQTAMLCDRVIVGNVPAAYTNVDSVDSALNLLPSAEE